jgi:hypothetical protein
MCPGRDAARLRRFAEPGTHVVARWAPDQQRTTPQVRRAAQDPGNANKSKAGSDPGLLLLYFRHRPPPGLASGEPDDRLRRTIQ